MDFKSKSVTIDSPCKLNQSNKEYNNSEKKDCASKTVSGVAVIYYTLSDFSLVNRAKLRPSESFSGLSVVVDNPRPGLRKTQSLGDMRITDVTNKELFINKKAEPSNVTDTNQLSNPTEKNEKVLLVVEYCNRKDHENLAYQSDFTKDKLCDKSVQSDNGNELNSDNKCKQKCFCHYQPYTCHRPYQLHYHPYIPFWCHNVLCKSRKILQERINCSCSKQTSGRENFTVNEPNVMKHSKPFISTKSKVHEEHKSSKTVQDNEVERKKITHTKSKHTNTVKRKYSCFATSKKKSRSNNSLKTTNSAKKHHFQQPLEEPVTKNKTFNLGPKHDHKHVQLQTNTSQESMKTTPEKELPKNKSHIGSLYRRNNTIDSQMDSQVKKKNQDQNCTIQIFIKDIHFSKNSIRDLNMSDEHLYVFLKWSFLDLKEKAHSIIQSSGKAIFNYMCEYNGPIATGELKYLEKSKICFECNVESTEKSKTAIGEFDVYPAVIKPNHKYVPKVILTGNNITAVLNCWCKLCYSFSLLKQTQIR